MIICVHSESINLVAIKMSVSSSEEENISISISCYFYLPVIRLYFVYIF